MASALICGALALAIGWLLVARRRLLARLEGALEHAKRLETLFEITPVGIAVAHDPECRTITSNPAAARILGVGPTSNISLSGSAPGRVSYVMMRDGKELPPEDLPLQRAVACRTAIENEELDVRLPDGRVFTVVSSAAPVRTPDGRVTGAVGTFVDVTRQRRASAELRASEDRLRLVMAAANVRERAARIEAEAANRAKDDFLAVVSHELRSPLNAIRLWTGVLRRGRAGTKTDRILKAIERSTVAQARVIEDLLDVSRIVAGKLDLERDPVDLGDVARAAVESMQPIAAEARVALKTSIQSGLVVSGDAARLQQVACNLLANAVKFSPAGTEVEVCVAGGTEAVLTVADHGKGIAPEFLPHVFERFRQADSSRTRENGGLGLGLAIAQHLVAAHGGTIAAESAGSGSGATFTVRLPRDGQAMRRAAPSGAPRGPSRALLGDPLRDAGRRERRGGSHR
jgi:PAS domain S-box-containing protein